MGSTCGNGRVWFFFSFPLGRWKGGKGETQEYSYRRTLASRPSSWVRRINLKGRNLDNSNFGPLAGMGSVWRLSLLPDWGGFLTSYDTSITHWSRSISQSTGLVLFSITLQCPYRTAFFLSLPPFPQSFLLSFRSFTGTLSLYRTLHHSLSLPLLCPSFSHSLTHSFPFSTSLHCPPLAGGARLFVFFFLTISCVVSRSLAHSFLEVPVEIIVLFITHNLS